MSEINAIKRKETIKRTSDLMLSGWKMLADCCPICTSVLMLSRSGDELRCPGCDMPIKFEKAQPQQALGASNESQEEQDQEQEDEVEEDDEVDDEKDDDDDLLDDDLPMSYEEMRREYELKNARLSAVSSKMGAKMLEGWTLLSESCPRSQCRGTPLMRAGQSAPTMLCVCCDQECVFDDNHCVVALQSVEEAAGETAESQREPPSAAPADVDFLSTAPFLFKHATDANDTSTKIGSKLLKGWALLDQCCTLPGCTGNVPLMRDRDGQVRTD
jgi:uncharacterized Zn finger protein (UPF0148 family)